MARSGRKHGIGNARILAAMQKAGDRQPTDTDALVYIGEDDRGVELYIIAVPDDMKPGGLTVIHCTPNAWRYR